MQYQIEVVVNENNKKIFGNESVNTKDLAEKFKGLENEDIKDLQLSGNDTLSFILDSDNFFTKSTAIEIVHAIQEFYPEKKWSIEYTEKDPSLLYAFLGEDVAIVVTDITDLDERTSTAFGLVDDLVGWKQLKDYTREVAYILPEIQKHKTAAAFRAQNFLLAVNEGCGLSTATLRLAKMLNSFKICEVNNSYEFTLTTNPAAGKKTIGELIEFISDSNNFGNLLCIDICEYLEKSKHSELRKFLITILDYEQEYIFAFRVPYIEQQTLKRIENIISDVLYVKTFIIPPYSNEELRAFAEKRLSAYNFQMDEEAWPIFYQRISEEKSDGRFYGLRTVDKVVTELMWIKHKADAKAKDSSSEIITLDEILELSSTWGQKMPNSFDELKSMIGMEPIIKRIEEIISQVKLSMKTEGLERPCMHMRFVGAPGTGKTTVARIVGRIFQENHILSNGYFFEYSARDLCGEYIGQTAPKTATICRDAYGSVLFIDEAYELYRGNDSSKNDYGKEAITTLIAEMENHREDLVVIMAGYKKDMETLMDSNSGLKSRMPFTIEFASYSKEQLTEIFMQMAQKHFLCDNDLRTSVAEYFNGLPDEFISSEEFSNARFVRNLYERTWSKAAMRAQLNADSTSTLSLSKGDFLSASTEPEFQVKLSSRKKLGY